ncbi:MAG: hypothetical protein ABIR79_22820 [Candidatus Binatia bacterium]
MKKHFIGIGSAVALTVVALGRPMTSVPVPDRVPAAAPVLPALPALPLLPMPSDAAN